MVAFKAFDPDPDLTDPEDEYFGTGQWTYDDGTSTYGQGDRDEAMRLWQRPDTRLAENAVENLSPDIPMPPGQESLNANDPQSDVAPQPLITEPPEPSPAADQELPRPSLSAPSAPSIPKGLRAAAAEMRGTPLSADQLEERQRGVYDRTMLDVAGVQNAAAERQRGREEALTAVTQHHEQFKADQLAQIKKQADTKAEAEANVKGAMAAQLDPGRAIKNMSTGQLVIGAIATAMGTLGNAMAIRRGMKTVSVTDWIDKAIEEDIQQQKEDKKSRIAYWTRVFGDADMGERAARSELNTAAGQYLQFQAQQKVTNADIQGQMMQDSAALMGKGQQEAQALVDRENERLTVRYQQPTPKGAGDAVAEFQKKLAARKAYEESGATPEQMAGFDAAMGIPSPKGESEVSRERREKSEARTDNEKTALGTIKLLDELGAQLGLSRDPGGTGMRADPSDKSIISKRTGEDIATGFSFGFSDNPIEATENGLIEAFGRLQSQGVISPTEEVRFGNMIRGAKTDAQRAIALNAIRPIIESKLNPRDKPQGGAESDGFRKVTP